MIDQIIAPFGGSLRAQMDWSRCGQEHCKYERAKQDLHEESLN
jgi:hypothetical protein